MKPLLYLINPVKFYSLRIPSVRNLGTLLTFPSKSELTIGKVFKTYTFHVVILLKYVYLTKISDEIMLVSEL